MDSEPNPTASELKAEHQRVLASIPDLKQKRRREEDDEDTLKYNACDWERDNVFFLCLKCNKLYCEECAQRIAKQPGKVADEQQTAHGPCERIDDRPCPKPRKKPYVSNVKK